MAQIPYVTTESSVLALGIDETTFNELSEFVGPGRKDLGPFQGTPLADVELSQAMHTRTRSMDQIIAWLRVRKIPHDVEFMRSWRPPAS
ncbi:hypothetical protein LWF15_33425 [Kineosporia rhizophila]|uniref:hypothetical protein n=1 Tax=Kineosporia rhizophila TaxID=84633 RepID=UPI000B2E9C43|nr:hypothetical protein [Kineosporia rhizophila]MCE0540406.1 hypothetical protein [Kineosporia rhizophila]